MNPKIHLILAAVLLLLFPGWITAQDTQATTPFSILRSSGNDIDIHFELPQWSYETTASADGTQRIKLEGTPYSGGAALSVLGNAAQDRASITLDFDSALNNERLAGRYQDALYPAQTVVLSEPQVMRDFRVVSINIYPFQYDQQSHRLIVRESMDIHIAFDNAPSINEMDPPTSYSSAFEKIYRGLILNYDTVLNREVTYTSPKMLVIYSNYADVTFNTKVNEYINWKLQKGFIVNAVNTTTTGTSNTAIKAYIQTQYNNTSTRPDYIVLIGDDSGTIAVPSYNGYIDYYYTWLAGGDNLGDVVIGRISVTTSAELVNYMAKVKSVEQNLNISTAGWLDRMLLVGDTASSGISTIYTNRYIHDHSYAINSDYTYTELYGSGPSSTTINAAINQGTAFYNYRGYMGMSGWPGTMSSMSNAYRLFHAVFITCATGSFNGGTSTTETVVRYGSEASMGGAITAIGMATTGTHTPMNNCLNVGIFHGVYPLGMRDMGSAMLYGKLYLYAIYGVSRPQQAYDFSGYCNLIGDPTATVYVSIPNTFSVTAPTSIPVGTSTMEVTVKDATSNTVEGATVTLVNASGQKALGFSGSDGRVLLTFETSLTGELILTISKDDFKPSVSTVSIASSGGVVYDGATIDDDTEAPSIGNANGEANAGETVELFITLKNTTASPITPSGNMSCVDPYVTPIDFSRVDYNTIAPSGSGDNLEPVVFSIAPDCPDQHQIILNFAVESSAGNFSIMVPVVVSNGKLNILSYTYVGATGNIIFPGNQFPMTISLTNSGSFDLSGINAHLQSEDVFFSVSDSLGYYGNINHGATTTNSTNTFTVFARGACFEGMMIPLTLYLYNVAGYEQSIDFSITVGQPGLNDPLGQDTYGYFIFDNTDTGYDQCPSYSWIGIAPAEGGSGTALSLTDPADSSGEGDATSSVSIQTVNLPFTFRYYGVDYSQVSISSNGFIAFGATQDADWRNWRMPDAGGPSPMVAVFWDDLDLVSGTSNVYTYYNSTQHYYVVEWYHMVSGYNGTTQQTFQAILYDPVFYSTHTRDGQIKIQYNTIVNNDLGQGDTYPHGNYSTVGIEDHSETDGLEYTFNNSYPTQAAPLANGRALLITTRPMLPDYAYVAIDQVNMQDTNSNNLLEAGESANLSIVLGNRGLISATDVTATLSSSDPYVTISSNYSLYGDIAPLGSVPPQTNYVISVSGSCPANHDLSFNLDVSCGTGSWNYVFTLDVFAAELSFTGQLVYDATGNQDGILDPGETAAVYIQLNNIGDVGSSAGTSTLSSPTTGITVNTGTASFSAIAAGSYEVLAFSISASPSIAVGTQVSLNYSATAGMVTANSTQSLEISAPTTVDIGTETSVNSGVQNSPITICNNSCHGQSVYTAAELNAAGVTGPVLITALGFYVASLPNAAMTDFVVRMKHTTATNVANWHTAENLVTTYSSASYMPAGTGYDMLQLSTPFQWNGTDNILVDSAFGFLQTTSNSGYLQYSAVPSGYRFAWSNSANQTEIFTGGNIVTRRYNMRFSYQPILVGPQITVNPTSLPFGNVSVDTPSVQLFTVSNTGGIALTGTITTPTGFSVSLATREDSGSLPELQADIQDRNILNISVNPGQTKTYNLTFTPTALTAYSGNVVVSTNATNTPTVNLSVSGTGILTALNEPVVSVSGSSGNFQLTWQAVPYAQQYKIYSASSPFGTYQVLTTTGNLSYTDTRVLGKAFYYVKAIRN